MSLEQDALLDLQEPLYKKIWGDTWDGTSGLAKELDEAEISMDSVLSTEMGKIEKATGADKVAKGTAPYIEAKKTYEGVRRNLDATEAQIKFLDKRFQSAKLKFQAEKKIGGEY